MNRTDDISHLPFLKILPFVVAGIVAANTVVLPLWLAAGLAVISFAATIIFLRRPASSLLTALTIFLFAVTITEATKTREVMPHGKLMVMTLNVTDTPETKGRWIKASAVVDKYRLYDTDNGEWNKSAEKVILRIDTTRKISIGDRLIATGYAGALGNKAYEGYVNLMKRRGYSATVWVGANSNIILLPEKHRTLRYYAARMQSAAGERLDRLHLSPEAMSIASAMSIGKRSAMDKATNESYSKTGTSHLLSVSGLHVGIIAMLVNFLLWLLPAFRYGHIIKNIVAIAVIWLYAFVTGLSPSVVRAAIMFTGAQAALASSRSSGRLNILLATATVMLLVNPNYLYDISFQLSFVAVAGIFLLYMPLYNLVKSRFKVLNAFWAVFMVGLAATLATTPLVSYYFGQIPVIGLIINPAVIATSNVVVLLSMLWIIIPVGFLNGIFSTAIGFCADLQNTIIASGASESWAALPAKLQLWQVLALYATALTAYFIVYRYRSKHPKPEKAYITVREHLEDK